MSGATALEVGWERSRRSSRQGNSQHPTNELSSRTAREADSDSEGERVSRDEGRAPEAWIVVRGLSLGVAACVGFADARRPLSTRRRFGRAALAWQRTTLESEQNRLVLADSLRPLFLSL